MWLLSSQTTLQSNLVFILFYLNLSDKCHHSWLLNGSLLQIYWCRDWTYIDDDDDDDDDEEEDDDDEEEDDDAADEDDETYKWYCDQTVLSCNHKSHYT